MSEVSKIQPGKWSHDPLPPAWKRPWDWVLWEMHWHNPTLSGDPCNDPNCLVKHERNEWSLAPDVIENVPPQE